MSSLKASTSLASTSTPNRNNYSAPQTPIASAKRPRQPGSKISIESGGKGVCVNDPLNGVNETERSSTNGNVTTIRRIDSPNWPVLPGRHLSHQMSPMHPPKPVPHGVHGQYLNMNETITPSSNSLQPLPYSFSTSNMIQNSGSSWVGRKVDAIFSPVLSFLNGKSSELTEPDEQNNSVQINYDCDVTMEYNNTQDGQRQINKHVTNPCNNIDLDNSRKTSFFIEPEEAHNMPMKSNGDSCDDCRQSHIYQQYQDHKEFSSYHQHIHEQDEHIYREDSTNFVDDSIEEDALEEDEEEFNPYVFIKSLPSYSSVVPYPQSKICLPPKDFSDPSISLVLDLDETLVHCTVDPTPDANMIFPVVFHGVEYNVHVKTRPHLTDFLEAVSKKFEVIVFTASQKVYANELLDRIDPDAKFIKHRMFRDSCLLVEGNYLKDLNVLGRELSTSVLVDNSPHAFGYQVDNGIPIESWFDDPHDTELLKLEQFLDTLVGVNDVRVVVRNKFQTYKLIWNA